MDSHLTGQTIRELRKKNNMTQCALAQALHVSDKAVSRWETGRGYPDITLIQELAAALKVSVAELMKGETKLNANISCNMLRSGFYVCPVCGNIIHVTGEAAISCCGNALEVLKPVEPDSAHQIVIENVEDEKYVTVDHEMTKEHFISFMAYVTGDKTDFVKLYPEGNAEARFRFRGKGYFYIYCNRHGLMRIRV